MDLDYNLELDITRDSTLTSDQALELAEYLAQSFDYTLPVFADSPNVEISIATITRIYSVALMKTIQKQAEISGITKFSIKILCDIFYDTSMKYLFEKDNIKI
jgi:hypothetical protein